MGRNAYILGAVLIAAVAGAYWYLHATSQPHEGWVRYTHPTLNYQIDYPESAEANFVEGGLNEFILGYPSDNYGAVRVLVFPTGSKAAPTREDFKYDGHPITLHSYDAWRREGIGTSDRYFIVTVVIGPDYTYQIEMDENTKGTYDSVYHEVVDSFRLR